MTISQRQLAASLLTASHIAERHAIAALIADRTTQPAPNPFPQTSVGAVRQVWRQRDVEFQSFAIEEIGVTCLLTAVSGMGVDEALVQEILRAGPHTANVFHHGDGCRIVGAVLYGKSDTGLPARPTSRLERAALTSRSRARKAVGQLDLFARA